MLIKLQLVILSIFFSCFSYAQISKIDSLNKITKVDSNIIITMNTLVRELITNDGKYSEAERYSNLIIKKSKAINYQKGIAKAYMNVGIMHILKGENKAALEKFFFILENFKNSAGLVGKSLSNIAYVYANMGNYNKALEYDLKSLSVFEKNNDKIEQYKSLTNVGSTFLKLNELNKALQYYDKSLVLAKEFKDTIEISQLYTNKGIIYNNQKNYEKALRYFYKSLEIIENTKKQLDVSKIYNGIANVYKYKNKIDTALLYYYKALNINQSIGYKYGETTTLMAMGECCIKNKNYAKAELFLLKALSLSNNINDLEGLQEANKYLSELYFQTNKHSQSLIHYKKYVEARDSLYNEENTKKMVLAEMNYEFDKKELASKLQQEIKLNNVKLENEKQNATKNIVLVITLALLVIGAIIGYVFYQNNKQKQSFKELEKNELKQRVLLSQMNPHFIFNSLTNIKGLIINRDEEKAITYLDGFSMLTRQVLEYSRENYIALQDELAMITNYLNIQQFLLETPFNYELHVSENINKETLFIPPMLTQPFVENAIKYGISKKNKNNNIKISYTLHDAKLNVTIEDNGKGLLTKNDFLNPETSPNHKSLSIKITQERLKYYDNITSKNIVFHNILNNEGEVAGFKVYFEMPYIYEK